MTIDDRDKPGGPLVRRRIRTGRAAALASLDAETGGTPYASLVLTACAMDASPVLLLSDLARHSRNLAADPRASLLFAGAGSEAVSQPRVTLIGRLEVDGDAVLRDRFMRRHATVRDLARFSDFRLYRMAVEGAHYIGGFGRIETLDAADIILDSADHSALAAGERDILDHMNAECADAVCACAHVLADRPGLGWRMTGVDPEGCDLLRSGAGARIDFPEPVDGPESARTQLLRLAERAGAPHATP